MIDNQGRLVSGNLSYYDQIGKGSAKTTREIENIYDPNAGALREATTAKVLADLNLGGALPADVQQAITRNSLQGASSSGLGFSPAARSLTARDLGLTSLDLGERRTNRAQSLSGQLGQGFRGFLNDSLSGGSMFMTPSQLLNANIRGAEDANRSETYEKGLQSENNAAIAESIKRIVGEIIGSIMTGGATSAMGGASGGMGNFSGGVGKQYVGDDNMIFNSTKATPFTFN